MWHFGDLALWHDCRDMHINMSVGRRNAKKPLFQCDWLPGVDDNRIEPYLRVRHTCYTEAGEV